MSREVRVEDSVDRLLANNHKNRQQLCKSVKEPLNNKGSTINAASVSVSSYNSTHEPKQVQQWKKNLLGLGVLLVFFLLGFSLVLPVWDKRTGFDVLSDFFSSEPNNIVSSGKIFTFGDTNTYAGSSYLARWRLGTPTENIYGEYASPDYDGTAVSISAYLKTDSWGETVTCALYTSNQRLYVITEEKTIGSTSFQWYTFNFSGSPSLSADESYYIVAYGNAPDKDPGDYTFAIIATLGSGGTDYRYILNANDYPNFPDQTLFSVQYNRDVSIYCSYTPVEPERTWQTLFNGYLNGGNNTVSYQTVFTGYQTGGNDTVKPQTIFKGFFTGGVTTSYHSVFHGFLTGGNTIGHQTMFTGSLTGGNETVSYTTLFIGYLSGGNVSPREWRTLFQGSLEGGAVTGQLSSLFTGSLIGGNVSVTYNTVFTGWLSGGNVSERFWQTLFKGHVSGSNETVSYHTLFTGYLLGGNVYARTWQTLFSSQLSAGNITIDYQTFFTGWHSGENTTAAFTTLFQGDYSGGNDTVEFQTLFHGHLPGGNTTGHQTMFKGHLTGGNITGHQMLFTGHQTGGNDTVEFTTLFTGWFTGGASIRYTTFFKGHLTGGNISEAQTMFTGWFTGGNTTLGIILRDEYPVNQTTRATINSTLHITIAHTSGNLMNITWYGSDNNGSSWFYLGSTLNVTNGTYGCLFFNASELNRRYDWRVMASDGEGAIEQATYYFNTSISMAGIIPLGAIGRNYTWSLGLLGVLMTFSLAFILKHRRKKTR